MEDQHRRADGIGRQRGEGSAHDAERRERTPAQDQRRRQRQVKGLADGDGESRHHHVASAARDVGQKVHQPDEASAAEQHAAVEDRHLERPTGEAHGGIEVRTRDQQQGGGEARTDQRDRDGDACQRGRAGVLAGAQRAADRRGDA